MSEKLNVDTLNVEGVEVSFTERGQGQPVLLLHGGAGPMSVVPWAEELARKKPARVITPIHPGFMGTPRPDTLKDVPGLARVYAELIKQLSLDDVTVIGSSIGGWIAAELALTLPVRKLVLVDATGIEVAGHPVADVFSLPLDELSRLSYYDPARFRIDPSKFTPEQQALFATNRVALKIYGGKMFDPEMQARLHTLKAPTLVVWGEADRIVDADYGRAYAEAISGARFSLLAGAGHMPQLETPELLIETVWPFISG